MTDWSALEQDMINKMLMQGSYGPSNSISNNNNNKDGDRDEADFGSGTKVYVEHHYVDHYNDPVHCPNEGSSKRRGPRGGVLVPFPEKLYQMLDQIAGDGLDDVVSFQPHGRCFVVHQPERFVKEVMPRYFSQTKLTSFQRQVNLYGFRRLTTGADRNGYYHELFLRGRPDLLKRMTRVRVKGIGCKLAPSPGTEPNLYKFQTCYANKMETMIREGRTHGRIPPQTSQPAFDNESNDSAMESYVMAQKASQCSDSSLGQGAMTQSLYKQMSGPGTVAYRNQFDLEVNSLPPALVQSFPIQLQDIPNDIDLTPLQPSSTGYLLDIQDDIINLLSDHSPSNAMQPMVPLSEGNILSDLANFWEV